MFPSTINLQYAEVRSHHVTCIHMQWRIQGLPWGANFAMEGAQLATLLVALASYIHRAVGGATP